MTEYQDFGRWVRERRRELSLTQKKLARLLQVSPVTVQKIEEGRRRPSPALAEALAQQLDLAPADLERFLHLARRPPPIARQSAPTPTQAAPNLLPAALTPLIGREQERADLVEQLTQGVRRLLTVTGPPGVGKTRLALEVAHDLQAAFEQVCFVPLAALTDAGQVWPDLARRLGLTGSRNAEPLERLADWCSERRVLLVLDNFEHVLDAAPGVVHLLEAAPWLRVLTTSREALRVTGEQAWPLSPLAVPTGLPDDSADLRLSPAVALFVERAQAIDPAFAFDDHSAPLIAEVVAHLDGLPLALELAAGRVRHLDIGTLNAQVQALPLATLGSGPRDGPERQRSLHAAIAWSYERLPPELQRGFRWQGVFAGGFTTEAAQAVAGVSPDDLALLLEANLLRWDAGPRYGWLETLRAFALEQLIAHGELDAARLAHARFYVAARRERSLTDLNWVEAEVNNLRAALQTATQQGQAELALRLAVGLRWFWETQGFQHEALAWYAAALALPGEAGEVDAELRAAILHSVATSAWQLGRFEEARAALDVGLPLARQYGLNAWQARMLMALGRVEIEAGDPARALEVLAEALPLYRRHGDAADLASALYQLADASRISGQPLRAQAFAEEGLALCRAQPGLFWMPHLLSVLGELALDREDVAAARTFFGEALELAVTARHTRPLSLMLAHVACLLAIPGASKAQLLSAARAWGAVQAYREAHGQPFAVPHQAQFTRLIEAARLRVPERVWQVAWASGRQLDLDEAVQQARTALLELDQAAPLAPPAPL